jgi:CBS domain-containing protein
MTLAKTRLTVGDVMSPNVVTASPAEEILAAASRMCTHHVSCVVVTEGSVVVGIFTQRDLLGGIAGEEQNTCHVPVAERMSSPAVTAPLNLPVLEGGRLLKSHRIKHLPVVAEERLVGIVTQTDITRGLIYLMPLQCVSEVMSAHIATVGVEATAADAARLMWSQKISCVVVMQGSEAAGVVSQRDILTRVLSLRRDPRHTALGDVMSTPVLSIPSHYSVFTASRMMDKMRVHRLVVQDNRQVRGIISQTDILQAVERSLAEEQRHWQLLMHSDIAVFTLDARGTITYANRAFLSLLEAQAYDQIVGQVLPDEGFCDSPHDRERLMRILNDEQADRLELAMRACTGETKRILLLLAATRSTCDGLTGWQGVAWPVARHKGPAPPVYLGSADTSSET